MKVTSFGRLLSIALVFLILISECGCRVIYSDTESTVHSIYYETVTVSDSESQAEVSDSIAESVSSGSKVNKPSSVRTEAKLSGKLEIQIFTNESQTADKGWTQVINAFEKETGVKVNAIMGSQVNTQMSTRWMQDNPPDLIWIDGTGIPDAVYRESGKYKNITSIIENGYVYGTDTKIYSVIDKGALMKYHGKYYHAPIMMATHGVWYDAAYLNQLGLSVPKNYDEFVDVSKKAVLAGTAAFTFPGQYTSYCFGGLIMPAIGAYGQEYLDSVLRADASAFTDSRMKDILTRYRNYCANSGFVLSGTTTMDHTTSQVRWLSHKALFITNGLWLADEVRKSTPAAFNMDYVTSPLITSDQQQTAVFYTKNMAIAANAKNPENAEAFLRYLYREDSQKLLMSSFGYMSTRTDIDYTNATVNMTKAAARALQYVNSGKVNIVYMHDDWGDVGEIFYNQINSLTDGKITVDQAMREMEKACKDYKK